MLKRVTAQLVLIFLFAFAQIGAATHEISHFSDLTKHNQQEKNTTAEQCGQCAAYAQVASGLQSHTFVLPTSDARFETATPYYFSNAFTHTSAYAARAPPITFNI